MGGMLKNTLGGVAMVVVYAESPVFKAASELSQLEKAAVVLYSTPTNGPIHGVYEFLNHVLRNEGENLKVPVKPGAKEAFQPYVDLLKRALTKLGVKTYDKLYRGVKVDLKTAYGDLKAGDTVRHREFLSTSRSEKIGDKFSKDLNDPTRTKCGLKIIFEGVSGVDPSAKGQLSLVGDGDGGAMDEQEVIILPTSEFTVVRVEKGSSCDILVLRPSGSKPKSKPAPSNSQPNKKRETPVHVPAGFPAWVC